MNLEKLKTLRSEPAVGAAVLGGFAMTVGTIAEGATGAPLVTGVALGLAMLGLAAKSVAAPARFDPALFAMAGLLAVLLPWLAGTANVVMWMKMLAGIVVLAGAYWTFRRREKAFPKAGAQPTAETG